ncbi:MAG: CoA transferase [Deltaproteobacteria bacterium]|nr:CoA transferase [Deltaproteobacteria bacterium]
MTQEKKKDLLLQNYRVLDLTDEKGLLCAKILADLGADVIKIEKPGGDDCRRFGPFFHGETHPEKSLFWLAYNLNKRGITLDIKCSEGKRLFNKLVENADFVIESFDPGYMSRLGLGYKDLSSINRRLIMTSITPFGQDGPRRDWKGSDIVFMATGGFMALVGDDDRPPVRISVDQASLHGCAEAVVASLIALHDRHQSGEGQYIDVSIQASVVTTTLSAIPFWDMGEVILKRSGPYRAGLREGSKTVPQQWACKDGFVSYAIWGGQAGVKTNTALVEWMDSYGMATELLLDMDWAAYDLKTAEDSLMNAIEEDIARFFMSRTKEELYQGALERRIQLYPIYTIEDIVKNPHLKARNFWEKLEHPELDAQITYPGAFAKSSEVDLNIYRRAPLIGEHNHEIYVGELGLRDDELNILRQAGII